MQSIRFFLIAAIVALIPTLAQSQIRLAFSWPDGLQATVTHTKSRVRTGSSSETARSVTTLYDLKALKRSDGLVVFHKNLRFDPTSFSDTERKLVDLTLIPPLPTIAIKPSGDFDHIEDVAGYRAVLLAAVGQPLSTLDDYPNFRQMMERFASESVLNMLAASEWNLSVGIWAGETLELGEEYRSVHKQRVPLIEQEIMMLSTIRINREIACDRAGETKKCLEIEMRTIPDQSELTRALEAFMQTITPQQVDKVRETIGSMDIEDNLLLITEPDGLIPHKISTSKKIRVTSWAGAEKKTVIEVRDAKSHYDYQ